MSKITVKHYLNKNLKPIIEKDNEYYPIYLSITYDRMNIRKPSGLNLDNGVFIEIKEIEELAKLKKDLKFKFDYEIDLHLRSVKYFVIDDNNKSLNPIYFKLFKEKKYKSKNERLNFLNSYIDFYTHSIYSTVSNLLKNTLKEALLPKITNEIELLNHNEIEFLFFPNNPKLYDLICKYDLDKDIKLKCILYNRFHSYLSEQGKVYGYDMPYIDWLENKGQIIFKKYLSKYKRSSDNFDFKIIEENIDILVNYINEIVLDKDYINTLINK